METLTNEIFPDLSVRSLHALTILGIRSIKQLIELDLTQLETKIGTEIRPGNDLFRISGTIYSKRIHEELVEYKKSRKEEVILVTFNIVPIAYGDPGFSKSIACLESDFEFLSKNALDMYKMLFDNTLDEYYRIAGVTKSKLDYYTCTYEDSVKLEANFNSLLKK